MAKKNEEIIVNDEDIVVKDEDTIDETEENEGVTVEEPEKKEFFLVRGAKKVWAHKKAIGIGILAFFGGIAAKALMDRNKNNEPGYDDDTTDLYLNSGESFDDTSSDETQDDVETTEF